jgi:hypothetical protein
VTIDIVPGIVIYNNVWMNTANCGPYDKPGTNVTMDYNSYYQGSVNSNDNSPHKKSYSTNPFVNSAAGNFRTAAATDAGIALAAPYNVDMDAHTRGADGVWDRGAFEFVGGVVTPPNPPTNVSAVVH